MGKHLDAKTKYHYVMRYLNGESPMKLGLEINTKVKKPNEMIIRWARKYENEGFNALISLTGKGKGAGRPKKKPKPNYEDMPKEELIEHLKIKDKYIDLINKKTRSRFKYPFVQMISDEFKISIKKVCTILDISRSGYYQWTKEPKVTSNYDQGLLRLIKEIFYKQKGNYGVERIMGQLIVFEGIKKNIKTIRRYMKHLRLQSEIRNPNKRSKKTKEIKDTKDIRFNYINGNFKNDSARTKLFTDTTEYKTSNYKIYFSAVIGADKNLYSLNASYRNNAQLVTKDINEAIKKVGNKFIIQFDNAAFYKSYKMGNLISSHKGISSFGKAGESKANWPIENFWSILKQEYLRNLKIENIDDAKKVINGIIFKYNHKRIQKKLEWKTPAQARV